MNLILFLGFLIALAKCDILHSDDYLFNINWPGNTKTFANPELYESITMRTKDNEQYECLVPTRIIGREEHEEQPGEAQQPAMELLKPLFEQTACSYKIDVYWNYELCHGRHARQYHESKGSGSETTVTGFYLGYYKPTAEEIAKAAAPQQADAERPPQTVLVEGQQLPYYEVVLRDGTVCDLSGQPRQTQVWYVCSLDGKGEIAELTETASCRYRIVVLTRQLCDHPRYRARRTQVNQLHCLPRADSGPVAAGKKPAALAGLEAAADKQVRASLQGLEGIFGVDARVEILHKGGQVFIAVHKQAPSGTQQPQPQQQPPQQQQPQQQPPPPPQLPHVSTEKFFGGSTCIVGGTTWWRHQVCYHDRITQFHVFEDGRKAEILLGVWHPEAHVAMATEQKLLPMTKHSSGQQRQELVQFYTGGDLCDLTRQARSVRLVLRCPVGGSGGDGGGSPTAVSIAFAEHQTCQYTVTLEGRMLCPIVRAADPATGVVPADALLLGASLTDGDGGDGDKAATPGAP